MISTHEFGQMKDGVVIVNTARGAIIDEEALVTALESGKVASVGLDVHENEPKVHQRLITNPHVLLLPHMGTWTVEVSHNSSLFSCGVSVCYVSSSPFALHASRKAATEAWCWVILGCNAAERESFVKGVGAQMQRCRLGPRPGAAILYLALHF